MVVVRIDRMKYIRAQRIIGPWRIHVNVWQNQYIEESMALFWATWIKKSHSLVHIIYALTQWLNCPSLTSSDAPSLPLSWWNITFPPAYPTIRLYYIYLEWWELSFPLPWARDLHLDYPLRRQNTSLLLMDKFIFSMKWLTRRMKRISSHLWNHNIISC